MICTAIHTEKKAWHQVGKEARFSLVADPGKKGGSTFPDCFPIPSGYYAAQFVQNSAVNEILFHIQSILRQHCLGRDTAGFLGCFHMDW